MLVVVTLALTGCTSVCASVGTLDIVTKPSADLPQPSHLPQPDHIVIVVEENRSYFEIILDPETPDPYIKDLAQEGASFTQSFAITHRSQPNYLALFSGSTQDICADFCRSWPRHSDDCTPQKRYSTPNLGHNLIAAGFSFRGYSESMPTVGYQGCDVKDPPLPYVRKHNPWVNWQDTPTSPNAVPNPYAVPEASNLPFTSFPSDFEKLPHVSFVIPNLDNDMHSGTVQDADKWLKKNLDPYVQWAKEHNSLLIVTWDEEECYLKELLLESLRGILPKSLQEYLRGCINQIPTIFVGPMVRPGNYNERIDHYRVLRTIEDMYKLPHAGNSAHVEPITDIWVSK